ncbi:MAG: prepilin-type N-terminal cleavage/methylation domain-containing protein [Phycisphaerales bacterium]
MLAVSARENRRTGAFTIIEALVVITVLSVLVALAASALARARESADRTLSLSKLRDLANRFGVYYGEYRDTFPYSTSDTLHPLPVGGPGSASGFGHFQIDIHWPMLMPDLMAAAHTPTAPHLAPKATLHQRSMFSGPGVEPFWPSSSYHYSLSFVADPAVWLSGTLVSETLLRAVKVHEAVFPARKVLLWDRDTPYLWPPPGGFRWDRPDPVPMTFVDGHAAQLAPADAQPGAAAVFKNLPVGGLRLRDTPGGVRGYDY